jgi:hypothetical protein
MPFIMPMPSCMAFMWPAISALRSSGVLAFIIILCDAQATMKAKLGIALASG